MKTVFFWFYKELALENQNIVYYKHTNEQPCDIICVLYAYKWTTLWPYVCIICIQMNNIVTLCVYYMHTNEQPCDIIYVL